MNGTSTIDQVFPEAFARMGGNAAVLTEIAKFFWEDSVELMREIERGLEQRDGQIVASAGHTLKGLVSNLDERLGQSQVQLLIHAARHETIDAASKRFDDLRRRIEDLRKRVEPFLN